ncbi:MAG TPA: outer membrane protein assembly factor BamE [Longimicrobium sp.]|nr:outer membrane protein assembly factor BamE [Longimicrobium sp.]
MLARTLASARTFTCAALLALGAAAPLAAQTPNTSIVPGFEKQIRFGISSDQVNAFWRETPRAKRRVGPVTEMDYVPWQGMNWTVMVHDQLGLIGIVGTSLPANSPALCRRIFNALVQGMNDELRVRPAGQVSAAPGDNLCREVAAGRGEAEFHWRTAEQVGVSVWVEPRDGLVHYVLGTDAFRQWDGGNRDPLAHVTSAPPAPVAAAPAAPPAVAQGTAGGAPASGASSSAAPPAPANPRNLGVTAAAYQALRPGMTLQQVEAIIGRPGTRGQQVQGVEWVTYRWTATRNFAVIVVSFKDGQAVNTDEVSLYPATGGTRVTLEQYRRLREGMSLQEVEATFGGRGDYLGFTDIIGSVLYRYRWRGRAPDSFVVTSFGNNGLNAMPTQFGLQ